MLLSGFEIEWRYETGVAYQLLVASGLLDKYPDMKLLIGHWGEILPYYFERLDIAFKDLGKGIFPRNITDYFHQNMCVTPNGLRDKKAMNTPMKICLDKFGASQIVWSHDYPYRTDTALPNTADWISRLGISREDKKEITHLKGENCLAADRSKKVAEQNENIYRLVS